MPSQPEGAIRVEVFKSRQRAETYVFVRTAAELDDLPATISDRLAPFEHALAVDLWPQRQLARVRGDEVLAALERNGFYLQLPPPKEAAMQNDRLTELMQHY